MYYEDTNQNRTNTNGAGTEPSGSYNSTGSGARYNPLGSEDETAPMYANGGQQGRNNGQGGYSSPYNGSPNASYSPEGKSGVHQNYGTPWEPSGSGAPRKKKPAGGTSGGRVAALVLACVILGGAAGFGGAYGALKLTGSNVSVTRETATVYASDRTPVITNTELVAAGEAMTVSQIYEAYNDSVVCITVQTSSGTGAGTGFFISDDGYIMTCYHVVDGQTAMSVTLNDGSTSYEAAYVGGDEEQDVAIIKINATGDEKFHAVTLGDSDLLQVGDTVSAIGNALGELANTTTSGIVSAKDRAITMSDGTVMNLLQTDCTINSGNSGGPLFNQYGEVVGIVNAKYSSSAYDTSTATIEGIGFSIPINDAVSIMSDLMEYGYITGKPYLGITVSTISSIMAQMYPNQYVVGALVNAVAEGSCAETAGLQAGDIITQVDGQDITTSAELIEAKKTHRAGEQMTMLVYRGGEYYTITVTLDEEQPDTATSEEPSGQGGSGNNDGDSNNNGNGYNDGNGYNGYFPWPWGYGGYGNGNGGNGGSGASGW